MIENELIKKLEYIGLDLNNIPKDIEEKEKIKYSPQEIKNEQNYVIYKYVNVNDIEILLTPTNRLTDIHERYEKALPLHNYLHEDNIENFTIFLEILTQVSIDDIETLNMLQDRLNKRIPLQVKYEKDYLWQIYYSEQENKYFMLAPINETEYAEIFYVLKKQLENKNEKIFVPICYRNFNNDFLSSKQIQEMEDALWFFTKKWPNTYEVHDKENVTKLIISGRTQIFENVESDYRIVLENTDEAKNLYNIVRALFLLQMNCAHYYNFTIKVTETANIVFSINGEIITTNNLLEFVKKEYLNHTKKLSLLSKNQTELQTKLKELQTQTTILQEKFLEKERQISTFLECKKTFIGKISYFIKYRHNKKIKNENMKQRVDSKTETIDNSILDEPQEKNIYTIQELLEITKIVDEKTAKIKNLELDIRGIEDKNQLLNKKIKNANSYIEEIDKHKRNIFDFWKFTSTKSPAQITEALGKKQNKINKMFNLLFDLDNIKSQLDEKVREILTKNEQDNIFIATTPMLQDINLILNDCEIPEEHLMELKTNFKNTKFDILTGGTLENTTNLIHRETEKNQFSIVNINENTTLKEYREMLENVINIINKAIDKISLDYKLPIYFLSDNDIKNEFNIFSINPLELFENIKEGSKNFYQVILDKNINILPLTNIIYFNNLNKTLPLGMFKGTKVLFNMKKANIKIIGEEKNNIVTFENDEMHILKLKITKYKVS